VGGMFDTPGPPKTVTTPAGPARPDAFPGPYITRLNPADEQNFQNWVTQNHVLFDPSDKADYDMRAFWKAKQSGDPNARQAANLHFPDTFKTPYHQTFSNESKYATEAAPHWRGKQLIDRTGKIVTQE
jgi:hypothetical protein